MECGVRFVVVEPLTQSKIDGVCFWLDSRSPVIGLSMRFDRIDNFWFVLRHEIEHVLKRDGSRRRQGAVDTDLQGERAGTGDLLPPEEAGGERSGSRFLRSYRQEMESFIARKNPLFYERDVVAFSRLNECSSRAFRLVQIQHRTGRYDFLQEIPSENSAIHIAGCATY